MFVTRNARNNSKPGKNSNSNKLANKGPRCYACNKYGHLAINCKNPSPKSRHNQKCSNQTKPSDSDSSTNEKSYKSLFALCAQNKVELDSWYVDSGTSSHISYSKEFFYCLDEKFESKVEVADYGVLKVEGISKIKLLVRIEG